MPPAAVSRGTQLPPPLLAVRDDLLASRPTTLTSPLTRLRSFVRRGAGLANRSLSFRGVAYELLSTEAFLKAAERGDVRAAVSSLMAVRMSTRVDELFDKETGQGAGHLAAANGHLAVLEWLHAKGGSLDLHDFGGCTPAHYAAAEGHLHVLAYLHAQGCRLRTRDKRQLSPEDYASLVASDPGTAPAVRAWLAQHDPPLARASTAAPVDAAAVSDPAEVHSAALHEEVAAVFAGVLEVASPDGLPWGLPGEGRCLVSAYAGAVGVTGGVLVLDGAFQLQCHPFCAHGHVEVVEWEKVTAQGRVSFPDDGGGGEPTDDPAPVPVPPLLLSPGRRPGRSPVSGAGSTPGASPVKRQVAAPPPPPERVRLVCTTYLDRMGTLLFQVFEPGAGNGERATAGHFKLLRLVPLGHTVAARSPSPLPPQASPPLRPLSAAVSVTADGERAVRVFGARVGLTSSSNAAAAAAAAGSAAEGAEGSDGGGGESEGGGEGEPPPPPPLPDSGANAGLPLLERDLAGVTAGYRTGRPHSAALRTPQAYEVRACRGRAPVIQTLVAGVSAELLRWAAAAVTYALEGVKRGQVYRRVMSNFRKAVVVLQSLYRGWKAKRTVWEMRMLADWSAWEEKAERVLEEKLRVARILCDPALEQVAQRELDAALLPHTEKEERLCGFYAGRRGELRGRLRAGAELLPLLFPPFAALVPQSPESFAVSPQLYDEAVGYLDKVSDGYSSSDNGMGGGGGGGGSQYSSGSSVRTTSPVGGGGASRQSFFARSKGGGGSGNPGTSLPPSKQGSLFGFTPRVPSARGGGLGTPSFRRSSVFAVAPLNQALSSRHGSLRRLSGLNGMWRDLPGGRQRTDSVMAHSCSSQTTLSSRASGRSPLGCAPVLTLRGTVLAGDGWLADDSDGDASTPTLHGRSGSGRGPGQLRRFAGARQPSQMGLASRYRRQRSNASLSRRSSRRSNRDLSLSGRRQATRVMSIAVLPATSGAGGGGGGGGIISPRGVQRGFFPGRTPAPLSVETLPKLRKSGSGASGVCWVISPRSLEKKEKQGM